MGDSQRRPGQAGYRGQPEQLANAAQMLSTQPAALQLRYLQTLSEIATENSSTTIFPIPIDILRPFYDHLAPKSPGESKDRDGG